MGQICASCTTRHFFGPRDKCKRPDQRHYLANFTARCLTLFCRCFAYGSRTTLSLANGSATPGRGHGSQTASRSAGKPTEMICVRVRCPVTSVAASRLVGWRVREPSFGAGHPASMLRLPAPSQVRPSATAVEKVAVIMARRVRADIERMESRVGRCQEAGADASWRRARTCSASSTKRPTNSAAGISPLIAPTPWPQG